MNEARDAVLARIRTALADRAAVPDVPRDYVERGAGAHDDVVARFVAQVEELGGAVVSAPTRGRRSPRRSRRTTRRASSSPPTCRMRSAPTASSSWRTAG